MRIVAFWGSVTTLFITRTGVLTNLSPVSPRVQSLLRQRLFLAVIGRPVRRGSESEPTELGLYARFRFECRFSNLRGQR